MDTPPRKYTVRFLRTAPAAALEPWVSNMVYGCDKSLSEWVATVRNYTQFSDYFQFIRPPHIAQLEAAVAQEFRVRACVQKFIRNLRMRAFRRRVVGEVDLYTTAPIPPEARVCVYDYPSKSVYMFHTHTAARVILSALHQSIYGIPVPQMPKNPYTNIPFSVAQIMAITEQVWINCARSHSVPPRRLFHFRECAYDVQIFKRIHHHVLNVESARLLLLSFHDPASVIFYMEVLDDTVDSEDLNVPRWSTIRPHFINRSVPAAILARMDALVLSLFLYQNHSLCYGFRTYTAMLDEFVNLYKTAVNWWKHAPRQIIPSISH
jgi:hypothetical protein